MGRYRSLVSSLTLSSALALLALALTLGGCNSRAPGSLALAPTAGGGQHLADTMDGGSGLPDGGEPGEDESGGGIEGGGGGIGLSDAQPTVIQSLFDFTQTGIAPWGPVLQTQQVTVNGQLHTINRLASSDPFTAMYQLENGDIVLSNRPVEELVCPNQQVEVLPPTEVWNGPEGPETIFSGQIMALFKPEVTQQQIEQFISAHNLHVIFSWFEGPEEPGQGNAIASFQFRYDPQEFGSFDSAHQYFSAHPLIEAAMSNAVAAFELDYTQGMPNDRYYSTDHICQQINTLGIDVNPYVDFGPPFGNGWISRTTIAVLDVGVDRRSQDFEIPGYPTSWKKISWNGITSSDAWEQVRIGLGWGEATVEDPDRVRNGRYARLSHGTQVAGTITAATNSIGRGTAGCAPRIGVLPVRLSYAVAGTQPGTSSASVLNALVALRKVFDNGTFYEDIRVTNSSFGGSNSGLGSAKWKFYEKWYGRDAYRCDRLHVASAGNTASARIQAPAALDVVLGVSGLVCTAYGAAWYPYLTDTPDNNDGSSYWTDSGQDPELRRYPVSGIYAFTNADNTDRQPFGYVTASPIPDGLPNDHYKDFWGTSFASPQVAALAALLREDNPEATFQQVASRIVQTRDTTIESYIWSQYGVPLAGLVDYQEALTGW